MNLDRVQLVVPDEAGLSVPESNIQIFENTDVTLLYSLVHASGIAYGLSGNVSAVMAFRATLDGPIVLQLTWTITNAALGYFQFNILRDHRAFLGSFGPTAGRYYYGVQFLDSDLNTEDAIMAPSQMLVLPQMGDFSQPITVFTEVVAGGSSPGGSNRYVQFNDSGLFGGDASFQYNKVQSLLTVPVVSGTVGIFSTALTTASVGRNSLGSGQLKLGNDNSTTSILLGGSNTTAITASASVTAPAFYGLPVAPSYSDATRPTASASGAGAIIFNTSDHTLNASDGSNWRDMQGNVT